MSPKLAERAAEDIPSNRHRVTPNIVVDAINWTIGVDAVGWTATARCPAIDGCPAHVFVSGYRGMTPGPLPPIQCRARGILELLGRLLALLTVTFVSPTIVLPFNSTVTLTTDLSR
jgi:hypothetical protein